MFSISACRVLVSQLSVRNTAFCYVPYDVNQTTPRCTYFYLFIYLSIYLFILLVYVLLYLFIYFKTDLLVCLFIYLFIYLILDNRYPSPSKKFRTTQTEGLIQSKSTIGLHDLISFQIPFFLFLLDNPFSRLDPIRWPRSDPIASEQLGPDVLVQNDTLLKLTLFTVKS